MIMALAHGALKWGLREGYVSGFQPLDSRRLDTWAFGPGWYVAGLRPSCYPLKTIQRRKTIPRKYRKVLTDSDELPESQS
jgi:hypothetical protein